MNFANFRPSVVTWFLSGVSVVTFILVMKWATTKWQVPGVTQVFQAV